MNRLAGAEALRLLGIEVPVVLGPMAGGPSTPRLAAAVSVGGGLGSLGEGYATPEQMHRDIRAVRDVTDRPFAVNLFVPGSFEVDRTQIDAALGVLEPFHEELNLAPPAVPEIFAEDFERQLEVVLDESVPVFTFTFGLLSPEAVENLQRSGIVVGGTATTVAEALALAESGVDFVVAQGSEAGGHRGSFLPVAGDALVGLTALVPQAVDATAVPVLAAGGMADGRGIAAALVNGASAAVLGTAFLACPEAGTSLPYRQALRGRRAEDTVVTSVFSGRPARGLANRFSSRLAGWSDHPPYPVLNALTRDLRRAATERGDAGLLSLWAGQGVALLRERPATEVLSVLTAETKAALGR